MSSNQTNFAGYCCRLVRVDPEVQPESFHPYGTIVKLSGLSLPMDGNQLYRQFPGLTLRVKDIQTEYILLTTHSLITNSSDLTLWKFSPDDFPGCKKTLDKYVVGVISCCGEESGFIIPGPSTAREHRDKICKLGLNFTILFLSEKFVKQNYLALFANQPNPPCVNINECKGDIEKLGRYLQPTSTQVSEAASISPDANVSAESSGTFEVVTGASSNGNVSLSAVEVSIIDDVESVHNTQESSTLRSSMELARDIVAFQKLKTVQCNGSSHLSVGMPLVYVSTDGQESSELIGMLTGEGRALIFSSLFYLLQGTPAACLSLVVYTEMWRLWTHKWSHLLLPYLENHPAQPKLILEILMILLERKDEEEEHSLSISRRADPDTRLGFLKFLEVLFHQFDNQSKEVITQMTAEVCTQAGLRVDSFVSDISGLCESLSLIAKYCCDYQDVEDTKIASLVEHCFICANEMLKFTHDQDVVEKVLCSTDKFESSLNTLQQNCPQSSVIMSNLVTFYRTLHTPCRRKIRGLSSSEEENEKLQSEIHQVKQEKEELARKYRTLKSQCDAASDNCQKTMNLLKDSEKRKQEISIRNEELIAENHDLKQQLMAEKESKQMLKRDMEKLRDDNRRLEEDKRKLEEGEEKWSKDRLTLETKLEHLQDVNKSLEIQNNELTETNRKMQRTNSDLSQQVYQMHRQKNLSPTEAETDSSSQQLSDLHPNQGLTMSHIPPTTVTVPLISDSVQAT